MGQAGRKQVPVKHRPTARLALSAHKGGMLVIGMKSRASKREGPFTGIRFMASHDFEEIVSQYYELLYRFAFGLTRSEADACDLTQQTFYIWATKGHQLHDQSKVKSWLFTTLYREFLNIRKRSNRFPHVELNEEVEELPVVSPNLVNSLDGARVVEFLSQVQEPFRAAVTLFYLNDSSYQEIADILQVPLGTVRSRISRGIAQLKQFILAGTCRPTAEDA